MAANTGGGMRKVLARLAAESKEDDWSSDLKTIIGQARVDMAQSGLVGDLDAAAHWPSSNRQARQVLLRQLADDPSDWEAADLAGTLARLDPTADEKRQTWEMLLELLAHDTNSRVANELATLATTADEKGQAREALLKLLTRETSGHSAAGLAGLLAQLGPTADEKRRAREALLELLAHETNSWVACWLAGTLAQLDPTADEKRQTREVLLDTSGPQDQQTHGLLAGG